MKNWIVYRHISPSGKVYIGITSNLKNRWRLNGRNYCTYNSIFKNAIEKYANRYFIFTVSPIRHIKDGLHENQLSKATLLLAIEKMSSLPSVSYFPSYEILLDELRDYRFYASDMMHPSETAIDYIWERFSETYLYESQTCLSMQELHQLFLDRQHRPLHPESEEYIRFHAATEARAQELKKRYPWL